MVPHSESSVDEENDPRYLEVGEQAFYLLRDFSLGPSIIGPRMLPVLLVEEEKGSQLPILSMRGAGKRDGTHPVQLSILGGR